MLFEMENAFDKSPDYRKGISDHYHGVIEPYLGDTMKINAFVFRVSLFLIVAMAAHEVVMASHDSLGLFVLKVLGGAAFWSFIFMLVHVEFHLDMIINFGTTNQKIFPFYHHYVDPQLYSKHRRNYHASQLDGLAILILPMFYIDAVVASSMVLAGALDTYTHQYYHTRDELRSREFNPVILGVLRILDRLGIIDTRRHIVVHHGHHLDNLDAVEGWMDVSWPGIGSVCDRVGSLLYRALKGRKSSPYLLYGSIAAVYCSLCVAFGVRSCGVVLAVHGAVMLGVLYLNFVLPRRSMTR